MLEFIASIKPYAEVAQAAAVIISTLTLMIGLVALYKSIVEYRNNGILKRFEKFQEMRLRFRTEDDLEIIRKHLSDSNADWKTVTYHTKEHFLGFYEEIALMNQSGLINTELTHYMFGYYAISAFENPGFRDKINLDSPYWVLFCSFCEKMIAERKNF